MVRDEETRDRATRIMATMQEQFAKFERLQRGGALRGADHPMSQYSAEHGKQMHDDYARKYSAKGSAVEFDSDVIAYPLCEKKYECVQ